MHSLSATRSFTLQHQTNMSLRLFSLLFVISLCLSSTTIARGDDCVYTVYVRTGSIMKGGTDSVISLTLYDVYGETVEITNLQTWGGLMGPDYKYFERGNLDIFSGRGECLSSPFCALNLTSDGSGSHHGWYCNYVEITATGVHSPCSKQQFTVEQWLALDTAPWQLTAFRNFCSPEFDGQHRDRKIKSSLIKSVV